MLRRFWKGKKTKEPILAGKPTHDHHLTPKELESEARRRLATIDNEFRHTFKFLRHYRHSVSFFGSARFTEDHPCYIRARALAGRISKELGHAIITGGGPGIMEAANRGAFEVGGKSVGMNIILPHEQKINPYLTANIKFYYFFIRKVALSFSAEAYIFFPGGFGTLDEFFELVTLIQTKKIQNVPIICVGTEYWQNVMKVILPMRDEFKTISPDDEKLFTIVETDEEVLDIIKRTPERQE